MVHVLDGCRFYHTNFGLNFTTWFMFAFPISLTMLVMTWAWLLYYFLGFKAFAYVEKQFIDYTRIINYYCAASTVYDTVYNVRAGIYADVEKS